MRLQIESMCADAADEDMNESSSTARSYEQEQATSIGPGGAFDSKWVPPVGDAPSRHTGTGGAADGVHEQRLRDSGAGSRVVPRRKQLGKQPDEAMSSSRGDARPPSGRTQEGRRQPPDEVNGLRNCIVASYSRFLGIVLDARGSRAKRLRSRELVFIDKRTGTARGPYKPACCISHKREVIGGAP
jgi:hypothetical protein